MQYRITGVDGNQYGPVDLATLKVWAREGRILPDTMIHDDLGNFTVRASELSELGLVAAPVAQGDFSSPPRADAAYPRYANDGPLQPTGTKLWSIIFWSVLALLFAFFQTGITGGVLMAGLNLMDLYAAYQRKDKYLTACAVIVFMTLAITITMRVLR